MVDKHSNCVWPSLVAVLLVYLQAFPVISQDTSPSGVTDTSTQGVTIATTISVTESATNTVTNAVTVAATTALPNPVTDEVTDNSVTEEVTNAATGAMTDAVTDTVTDAGTNKVTDAMTEAVTDTVTDAGTSAVTGAMTDAVTDTVTDAGTSTGTGVMTEAVTDTVTDAGTNAVTDAVTETSISPDVVTDVTDLTTKFVDVAPSTDASTTSNITHKMDQSNISSTLSPNVSKSEKKVYRLDQTRTVIIPIIIFTLLIFLLVVMIFIATYTRIRLKKSITTYRLTPAVKDSNSHVGYQNTAYEHGDIADDTDIECSMRDLRLDVTSTNGDTMNIDPEALKNPEGLEEELTPL